MYIYNSLLLLLYTSKRDHKYIENICSPYYVIKNLKYVYCILIRNKN